MKIALVQDFLCAIGGSERIFQYLCEEFQEADLYTLAFRAEKTLPYFNNKKIRTTWLNPLISNAETFRWAFAPATFVMQRLDLSHYDIVLTSSATTAKYVKTAPGRQLCYCYIPTRALWHTEQYFGGSFKKYCIAPFLSYLKKRDYQNAQQIGRFIAISEHSKRYIQEYYNRDADVIPCPIETDKFKPNPHKQEHYLLISRLENWKKLDYAIEAFNRLGKPLKIIGTGKEEQRLKNLAKPNISFLGNVDDERLVQEYSKCRAVIFTPFLEYGLIPLEASASGTPVICYGKGGVEETMIPYGHPSNKTPTAYFFYEQTAQALMQAVQEFETLSFDSIALVEHAAKWSVDAFRKKMREALNSFALQYQP